MAAVALLWMVSGAGKNAGFDVGAVAAAELAAPSLLAPVLGPYVDRWSQRNLLVGADLARVATTLTLPFAYKYGGVLPVGLLALIQGTLSVVFSNTGSAVVPENVTAKDLAPANAWLMTANHAAAVLGSALGGILVQFNTMAPFAVDALTYLLSAGLLLTLGLTRRAPPRRVGRSPAGAYWRELRRGVHVARTRPAVRRLARIGGVATVGFAPASVAIVVLVRDRLAGSGSDYGAVRAAAAIGLALGAQVGPWLARRLNSMTRTMSIGYIAMGMLTVGLGLSPNVAYAVPLALVRSGSNSLLGVPSNVLLQQHVPSDVRGRVITLLAALEETPRLIILPLAGLLVDWIGVRWVFLAMAAPIIAAGSIAWTARRVRDGPKLPQLEPDVASDGRT